MELTRVLLFAAVTSLASGHAIPIWEMLPRQEKMGQILYTFVHLVDQTCAYSYIPDCHHVLTLHGLSNLVNMDEYALNRLDPFQAGARQVIWDQVMRGVWDLPPAYLPYYLRPQGDEITNEIDSGFPSSPQPSPPALLYPYAAIPNTLNKPVAAVSDPHPYAVKVAPPPGFSPNPHVSTPGQEVEEVDGKMTVSDSEVTPEDRFAGWSDSEAIVGSQQTMEDEFQRWSETDVIVGNLEPVEDIYASWSDAEMIVSDQQIPEDRYASWSDTGAIGVDQEIPEDRYASWSDTRAIGVDQEIPEDRYASWSDTRAIGGDQEIPEDRYASWSDTRAIGVDQEIPEDRYASWSDTRAIGADQEIPEDRYASWSDTRAIGADQEIPEDRYASWSDTGAIGVDQEIPEDRYASWSDGEPSTIPVEQTELDRYDSWSDPEALAGNHHDEDPYASWSESESTSSDKPTQTDRYAAWSDSEARLSDHEEENGMPAGIQATANFEPVMVESSVVVSRVAPPASMGADESVVGEQQARTRRSVGDRLLLPLPLLRQ